MGDFDFLAGSWNVERPAQEATRGSDDWDVHPGTTTCHRVLGDVGTADEIIFPGYSLRLFDTEHGRWASYRANSRTRLRYPPVFGTFAGGRGDFYGDGTHEAGRCRLTSCGRTSRPRRPAGSRRSRSTAGTGLSRTQVRGK